MTFTECQECLKYTTELMNSGPYAIMFMGKLLVINATQKKTKMDHVKILKDLIRMHIAILNALVGLATFF